MGLFCQALNVLDMLSLKREAANFPPPPPLHNAIPKVPDT